jgi:hypothetical protein
MKNGFFVIFAISAVLGTSAILFMASPVEAKVICTLKKGNTTIQISTGHNNPSDTYKQINGGGWSQVSGTAQANCAKYRARGYK